MAALFTRSDSRNSLPVTDVSDRSRLAIFILPLALAAAAVLYLQPGAFSLEPEGSNIFSLPPEQTASAPSFVAPRGRTGRARDFLDKSIPSWEQIRAIPSLSPMQRRQIRQIFQSAREDSKPLLEQLKAMRQQHESTFPGRVLAQDQAGSFAQGRSGLSAKEQPGHFAGQHLLLPGESAFLRKQLRARREDAWKRVQSILTEEQLNEFELMRNGQLMPAGND